MTINREAIEDVAHQLRQWADAYPEEMFGPLTAEERQAVMKVFPGLVDRVAAMMGRHIGKRMREIAGELDRALVEPAKDETAEL